MTAAEPKPYDVDGLAGRWEVAPGTIYKMIKRGEIRAFRAGKSCIRIAAAEVERIERGECGDSSSTVEHGAPSVELTERPSAFPYRPRIATLRNAP